MFLPPGFDKPTALEAAHLVNQAYDQFTNFEQGTKWSLQGNYDTLGVLSAKPEGPFARLEPFGFVARNRASGSVFVTFRGTKSVEDWLSNISFPQVPHPWGAVEQGFSRLYGQCSADAQKAVRSAAGAPNVIVTGHSLGGALATLAAADLVNSGVGPGAAMYNLASPRVGNRAFAAEFNGRVAVRWRIVNTEDIVTTVPLATPVLSSHKLNLFRFILMFSHKLDYEHVGNALSFSSHKGSIATNHEMPSYIEALNSA